MNIILNSDGSITKTKIIQKKDVPFASYFLIDISTERKGPLYTLVKDLSLEIPNHSMKVTMDISFSSIDIPFDDTTKITSELVIDTIEKKYSVYPLIKQMFGFNQYRERNVGIDNEINIDFIKLELNNSFVEMDEDWSDKKIKKLFNSMRMTTVTDHYLTGKYIILTKSKWMFIDEDDPLPKDTTFVGIPIAGSESLYLISINDYLTFQKICEVSISISYLNRWIYERCFEYSAPSLYDSSDYYTVNIVEALTFSSFLESCIYFPQMLLLEHSIYNEGISIQLLVETISQTLEIYISDKESQYPKNTCIYNIIKKLLQI